MNVEHTINEKNSEATHKRFITRVYDRLTRGTWLTWAEICALCIAVDGLSVLHGERMQLGVVVTAMMVCGVIGACKARTRYVKAMQEGHRRFIAENGETTVSLTDAYYEFSSGGNVMRIQWRSLGSHYLFLDEGVVVLLNGNPRVFLTSLPELGVDPAEFRGVLVNAGLKDVGSILGLRRHVVILLVILGILAWLALKGAAL